MKKEDCFYLGKVVKTHGLKGEVTLKIDADDPSAYVDMKHFFLEINKVLTPFFVEKITPNGDKFFVQVQDVKTIEMAQNLVGKTVYLPLEMLPKLSGKQFYFHEIVGFTVVDTEKGELGPVSARVPHASHPAGDERKEGNPHPHPRPSDSERRQRA